MSATITVIDHIAAALAGLLTQFRGKFFVEALMTAIGGEYNFIEAALQEILTTTDVDASEGAQLDVLGRLFGQPRGSQDDATYRLYIHERVAALRDGGDIESLYSMFQALSPGCIIGITPQFPASFTFTWLSPALTDVEANAIALIIRQVKPGGVGCFYYSLTDTPDNTFAFAGTPGDLIPWGDKTFTSSTWGSDSVEGSSTANGFADTAQTTGGHFARMIKI
jgi:hypothetical protein